MIILGSASKQRLELLNQINIYPDKVIPSLADEAQFVGEKPLNYVRRMALTKATSISSAHDDCLITADTIVLWRGKILHKTCKRNVAREYLLSLSGRRHAVYTAFCVKYREEKHISYVKTKMKMKLLSEKEIEMYLDTDQWKNKAGAYAIQGLAVQFLILISGCYSNVVGLPLPKLVSVLKGKGILK